LTFYLKIIVSPVEDAKQGGCENPGRIQIVVCTPSGETIAILIDKKWDVLKVLDWFLENRNAIDKKKLPISCSGNGSISEQLRDFYDLADECDDEALSEESILLWDAIYEYRQSHAIRFAFRGTDVIDVHIGKTASGHEISYAGEDGAWSYIFDFSKFYDCVTRSRASL
jgi:hypothetical protein